MSKRRLYICLVVAALVILLGLVIAYLRVRTPLWYLRHFTENPRELPTRLIRPAFRMITRRDLPQKADGLRALFRGGRGLAIFVRFETDSEGIAYVEAYGRTTVTIFDRDFLRTMTASNSCVLPSVHHWQEKIGVHIFDQETIESGRLLRSVTTTGTALQDRIFIDDQRSIVYMYSWLD